MNRQALTVTRYGAGTIDDYGEYTNGSTSTVSITASVQPVTGKNLESLPEGRQTKEAYYLFTDTELLTSRDKNKADTTEIFSDTYEVINIEKWQNNLINHYKVTVSRI
ncbi:MAG: hypothetical protein GY861_25420 [bacterium]|nr:hypothetical protein [bacterium]